MSATQPSSRAWPSPGRSPTARSIARAVRGASGMVTTLGCLAGDGQGAVPALQAEMLDVGAGSFENPQPFQREQGDQRVLGRRAELVTVKRDGVRLVVNPRTADVCGG